MKRIVLLFIMAMVALTIDRVLAQAPQSVEARLKAAQHKEEVEGDLKGAIDLYKTIARSSNHPVEAAALVRMAGCYEKLGNRAEARRIYEHVVREYSDQSAALGIARARLGRGESPQAVGMLARQVWTSRAVDLSGTVDPEGRYLSFYDQRSGDLALRDLVTGVDRRLTTTGNIASFAGQYAQESAFSRDGKQIAYGWFTQDHSELRVVDVNGVSRQLLKNGDVRWLAAYDWSPDDQSILIQWGRKDGTSQLVVVAVRDGSARVLRSLDWRGTTKAFFSPDGKLISYDQPAEGTSANRDVFILALDGSRELRAISGPAEDMVMGWSPDGSKLLFASDRGGEMGLWALPIDEGTPAGDAVLVRGAIGTPVSLGFTRTGALYVGSLAGDYDVQLATMDFTTGALTSPLNPIKRFIGSNTQPVWSPDGGSFAYVSRRGFSGYRNPIIVVKTLASGEERELRPELNSFFWPQWSPDGASFIVQGTDLKGRQGIYRIDGQSGHVSVVALSHPGFYFGPRWSRDGRRIYFNRNNPDTKDVSVMMRVLSSGEETELMRRSSIGGTYLSPNAEALAAHVRSGAGSSAVMLIPVDGAEARELVRVSAQERLSVLAWTTDSRAIIVRKILTSAGDRSEVWSIPADGSEGRKLNVDPDRITAGSPLEVHPDGRQILFVRGSDKREVWALENIQSAWNSRR